MDVEYTKWRTLKYNRKPKGYKSLLSVYQLRKQTFLALHDGHKFWKSLFDENQYVERKNKITSPFISRIENKFEIDMRIVSDV